MHEPKTTVPSDPFAGLVLASGPGWLALNKPYWMSAHNAAAGGRALNESALQEAWRERALDAIGLSEALLARDRALAERVRPERRLRPSPCHRLDVGTSGALIMAASAASARLWPGALLEANKTYVAVTRNMAGSHAGPALWSWPLTDRAEGRRDPQGAKGMRRESATRVRVLRSTKWFTWLEAELLSGRTHQIRRHAALAGATVLGDSRYGTAAHASMIAERYGFDRLALHAARLSCPGAQALGIVGAPAAFEAPLPEEFARLEKETP